MYKASGCGAVGSALPWGGRGRGFKSRHSDHIGTIKKMHAKNPLYIADFWHSESKNFIVKTVVPSILTEEKGIMWYP